MNYEEMSDFEINKLVAKSIGYKNAWTEVDSFNNTGREGSLMASGLSDFGVVELNYCNR